MTTCAACPRFSGERRIVVDWDGTCVEAAWPQMGDWLPGARRALHNLLAAGFEVVIFSTRLAPMDLDERTPRPYGTQDAELDAMRQMLNQVGLERVDIWTKPWKPGACAYIDDRALRFSGDWAGTLAEFHNVCPVAPGSSSRSFGRDPADDSTTPGFEILDSGVRHEYQSGMRRDAQEGKTDWLLVRDGPMLRRDAEHLTKGAVKYGRRNWMLAASEEELERFRSSAARHFEQWLNDEADEDHAAAVRFNINAAEHVKSRLS